MLYVTSMGFSATRSNLKYLKSVCVKVGMVVHCIPLHYSACCPSLGHRRVELLLCLLLIFNNTVKHLPINLTGRRVGSSHVTILHMIAQLLMGNIM